MKAAAAGFLCGALLMWIAMSYSARDKDHMTDVASTHDSRPDAVSVLTREAQQPHPPHPETDAPPSSTEPALIGADPIEVLRRRHLTLPVSGLEREDLHPTFNDLRGSNRRHEALDILAPRNTPVVAVEDGRIARLFLSKAGGLTIYQFDPTGTYDYYYAHLERYAAGLAEGDAIKRGQIIGYVGTSGNAPPDTPHLHFAIFKMTDEKKWWQGTPLDPYPILR